MKLGQYYLHIDNGGPAIRVIQSDDEYKSLSIEMETSYHGYPSVVSTLSLSNYAPLNGKMKTEAEILQEIGLMFLEASNKLK